MSLRASAKSCIVATAMAMTCAVHAGPDWEEGSLGTGDAGSLVETAQIPVGIGPLQRISGELTGQGFAFSDFQDGYLIFIPTPTSFSATTNPTDGVGAFSSFDSQLWLFDASGLGLLGADGAGPGATLGPVSTDGSGSVLVTPGLYFLVISSFNSDPVDGFGAPIFDQATFGEISGPDGPGGANPLADWTPTSAAGAYTIVLTSVTLVPGPGGLAFILIGSLAGPRRQRRPSFQLQR